MRRLSIVFTVLAAATFAAIGKAEDTPRRSAELQVLDHFLGTWDHEVTINRFNEFGQRVETKNTDVDTRKWSAGGTFVIFENSLAMKKNPDVPELIMMITYDPETHTYPGCMMSGPSRTSLTGIWNERTQTMHWRGKDLDENKLMGKHQFIGKDRAEASLVITNPASTKTENPFGKLMVEISWKQTRRK